MGLNVKVPRELTEYKEKFFLGLTLRQLACVLMAAIIGLPAYLFCRRYAGQELAGYVIILISLPILAFAVVKKNDLPFEKYLIVILKHRFILPKIRTYQTKNVYEVLAKMEDEEDEQLQNASKKKSSQGKTRNQGTSKKDKKRSAKVNTANNPI